MAQLPEGSLGIDDFTSILKYGFSQTLFNGLKVGEFFEYRSEVDKRVLVMKVNEITYDNEKKPVLSISKFQRMYCRE